MKKKSFENGLVGYVDPSRVNIVHWPDHHLVKSSPLLQYRVYTVCCPLANTFGNRIVSCSPGLKIGIAHDMPAVVIDESP